MEKNDFTEKMRQWLESFLKRKLASTHTVLEVLAPTSSLAKLNNEHIKGLQNYSSWDFKPDVFGIIQDKTTKQKEVVLLNRSTSALSLKEIGEINCYARLTKSTFVFLASTRGLSSEVNILLLDDDIRKRILQLNGGGEITIFAWDEKSDSINQNSIVPFNKKDFLLN